MPDPINTLLLLSVVFCILFVLSLLINAIYVLKGKNLKDEQTSSSQKIYYIEKYKKPRKKRARKPTIALKGSIITPEELNKIKSEEEF